jgi:hypothetical protein
VTGAAVPAKPMQSQRQLAHRRNAPVICATDGVESLVALFRPPAPIEKRATS